MLVFFQCMFFFPPQFQYHLLFLSRCVDIAETGMYSTVFFECAAGTVFSKELATCVPGICLNQALPQGPVLMNPTISSQSLGLDSGSASEGSLPPSPPPPPPPSTTNPPPPPTTPAPPVTIGSTAIQVSLLTKLTNHCL